MKILLSRTRPVLFSAIVILAQPFAAAQNAGQTLSDAAYLRKLSMHIRGVKPSLEEYDQLKRLERPGEKKAFFEAKLTEYFASAEHQDRMIFRLGERFQVKTPEVSRTGYEKTPASGRSFLSYYGLQQDSLTDLFARLGRDNLSWDELLTGKSYTLYAPASGSNFASLDDYSFFKLVIPGLPESPTNRLFPPPSEVDKGIPWKFEPNDIRVAGALTTPRFLSRYNTTNVNKNRRRAAAVYRIFLCDAMVPVIPASADKKNDAIDSVFEDGDHPSTGSDQLEEGTTVSDEARHGSDPKCMSCHYKLDPMGKTFQNIGIALHMSPAPGALIFKRATGELFERKVRGLGELGAAITRQPEYVSCQIDWFWEEFIGKNVPLSPKRKGELIEAFDRVGRRTNDFIRILVTSPEFREKPKTSQIVPFDQVSTHLKRCDTCHSSFGRQTDFGSGTTSRTQLLELRRRLSLPENDPKKMPLDWRSWSPAELDLLKRWLQSGAHDKDGKPQLTSTDLGGPT